MRSALLAAVVLAVVPTTAVSAGAASETPVGIRLTSCLRLRGPVVRHDGRTQSHYLIGLRSGVACGFARTWVTTILHEATPNGSISTPRGPAGWSCIANTEQHVAFNGSCRQGTRHFSWGAT